MRIAIYLTFLASLIIGCSCRPVGRWLGPAAATRLIAAAALVAALGTGFSLAVIGFTGLAQVPDVAGRMGWSASALHRGVPVSAVAAAVVALAVVVLFLAAIVRACIAVRGLWIADQACRQLPNHSGGLVIVSDIRPDAYALPGRHGRVVVSTAMLRALPADERRVLLAHEESHLRHHHHLYVLAAAIAAAANPLLRPAAATVRFTSERWADEDAAATVEDRALTARALARAGLARAGQPQPTHAAALGIARTHLGPRVRAMLKPPPPPRRVLQIVVAAAILLVPITSIEVAHDTERLFENAKIVRTSGEDAVRHASVRLAFPTPADPHNGRSWAAS